MKKNKGFTLVELLGVLVITMLLLLLAFPNFSNLTNKAKSNYDSTTRVLIKSAATMYVNNNMQKIENAINNSQDGIICIPLGTLVANEYLDSDLEDSQGNKYDYRQCIYIEKQQLQNNKVEYTYTISEPDESDPEKNKVQQGTSYLNYIDTLQ